MRDVTKALAHLHRKVATSKYSTEFDKKCINDLIHFLHGYQEDLLRNQTLFFNLYVYLYGQLVKKYETTVSDPMIQKELHRLLDKNPAQVVQEFLGTITMAQISDHYLVKGETSGWPEKAWTFQEVDTNLRLMAFKALERFSPPLNHETL